MSIKISNLLKGATMAVLGCLSAGAMTQIDLGLDTEFSGGVPPVNTNTPWLCAQFTTVGDDVLFTLSAPNLTDPEGAAGFYFNFDDSLNLGALVFNLIGTGGTFTLPTIDQQQNTYKADGDGKYDIRLNFATGGDVNSTFGAGDSITYLLSYSSPITEQEFAHLSLPAGGHGPFYAAAHVQNTSGVGTGTGQSGWIAATEVTLIPEPSAIGLAIFGLTGLGAMRMRKHNNH